MVDSKEEYCPEIISTLKDDVKLNDLVLIAVFEPMYKVEVS